MRRPAAAGSPSLPHSSRNACTSALIGFHSASQRSTGGIPSGLANALLRKVIGKMVTNMTPCTASTERSDEPTRMPIQIIMNPNSTSSP